MPSQHFGDYGVQTPGQGPNHGKPKFLKPLPHAHDECGCRVCDEIRKDNGMARVSVNWPRDYPPAFYEWVEVDGDEYSIDWAKEFEGWEQ
jgi:hypothetical protein